MSELHDAAASGDISAVSKLLYGLPAAFINARDEKGYTPFWIAAREGHVPIARMILEHGGSEHSILNARSDGKHTPLSVAVVHGNVDMVRFLLGQPGVELNTRDHNGHTPLTLAAMKGHESITELLLQMEDIDLGPDGQGRVPLSAALECRQLNIAVKLVNAERRRNPLANTSQTLLSWAAENDKRALVRQINDLSTINPNLRDEEGRTPLSRAAARGNLAMVRLLLEKDAIEVNQKDKDGSTPLSRAAENQHENVVQLLAAKDNVTLHSLVQEGNLQLIDFLLACNIDVDCKDVKGQTALHTAVIFDRLQIAERLISRGANLDAEDASGKTPLLLAVRYNFQDFIELLLSRSASMRGIKAEDWRKPYRHHHQNPILYISERVGGGIQVDFTDSVSTFQAGPGAGRSMLQFSNFAAWSGFIMELGHRIKIPKNNRHIHWTMTSGCIENWLGITVNVPHMRIFLQASEWDACGIAWSIGDYFGNDASAQKTKYHYSMLPNGWIPDDGIEFFQQLIVHVTEKWSDLCNGAEDHLSDRRTKQLQEKGHSEIINKLAEDASNLAELRRCLRSQVSDAKRFVVEYGRVYNAGDDRRAHEAIESFADIDHQLQRLDQTIRDLLQLEFAWVSINEAHKSTSLGTSMKRLSWITFIFLPAMFASSVFGMNVDIFAKNPDWRWYLLFVGTTLLLTISVWLLFKYLKVEARIEKHVHQRINEFAVRKRRGSRGTARPPV